jgi:hypothetical protein
VAFEYDLLILGVLLKLGGAFFGRADVNGARGWRKTDEGWGMRIGPVPGREVGRVIAEYQHNLQDRGVFGRKEEQNGW